MKSIRKPNGTRKPGFTLIELLIVVAIIAILAAIAVPNFLEAQTRSKVSRLLADMRSIKVGLESYRVDTNKYPETDLGNFGTNANGVGMYRLTTPIAYLTSVPKSPFTEANIGAPAGSPKNSNRFGFPLYVRAEGIPTLTTNDSAGIDENYKLDRLVYLLGVGSSTPANLDFSRRGYYGMKSVGPNNIDDRDAAQIPPSSSPTSARVYDPTNGTVSDGDIVTYQDTSILASGG
ncbi:prepilin-type N-terminal cleavage/methylation domain-containing protein [Candidatus Poribacteria bacterium]|nr:prepilin-type N-terminal cleavage/methylation domain-containing protein [Candidatus Poribacteria bacterium]